MAGAYVSATYLYPDVEGEALADETWTGPDGTYTLESGCGASQYRFHVSAPGYIPQYVEYGWDGATPLVLDFVLVPVRTVATGTVTDADTGLPVEGAFVSVAFNAYEFEWVTVDTAYTGPDGTYTLEDPLGYGNSYELVFTVIEPGYVDAGYTGYWTGVTPLLLDFALTPTRTIATGIVTGGGTPIGSAYVRAYQLDGDVWVPVYMKATAADGTYTITDPYSRGAGEYKFTAEADGYRMQTLYSTWDGATPLQVNFALVADAPPVATPDSYTTAKNTKLTVAAPGVLANDVDPEGSALTAYRVAGPSVGTLVFNSNGSFTYTPQKNWTGTTSFTYRAYDGALYSNSVTVTITVKSTTGRG